MNDGANKPDWEFYGKLAKAKLHEAILLSLDIDPRPKYIKPMNESENEAVRIRSVIVSNWLNHPDCFHFIYDSSPTVSMNRYVDLKSFGTWCLKIGLSIPDQFPREIPGPLDSQSGHTSNSFTEEKSLPISGELNASLTISRDLPYITTDLKVLFKAMRIVKEREVKTKKEIMNIIREVADKNLKYDIGDNSIKYLATVIFPDELAAHEKRSRKHPSKYTKKPINTI